MDVEHAPPPNWTAAAHPRGTCILPSPIVSRRAVSARAHIHPGFTPISPRFLHLRGQQSGRSCRGDLLPSKQVVAGSIPVSRSTPIKRYNARMARAAERRPPAFQAGRRGSVRLRPHHLAPPLAPLDALELLAQRKDAGLLLRESWVRIPPGPLGRRVAGTPPKNVGQTKSAPRVSSHPDTKRS